MTGNQSSRNGRSNSEAVTTSGRTDYLTYLSCFYEFSAIPSQQKTNSSEFQEYLRDLKTYLFDFYRRTQPLVDLDDVIAETSARFEKQWALNQVKGWDFAVASNGNGDASTVPEFFCALCDKQFSSDGVYNGHLNGKKHKKAATAAAEAADGDKAVNGSSNTSEAANARLEKKKTIAFDEVLVRKMYELLTEVVHATIAYVEAKQTRTHEELLAEVEEEEEGTFSDVDVDNENGGDGDDDDQPFYNPLNLPLGWDGKPIPYWLYKLHGLGVEYKCEICGNHSYWGRRAFDRHFQEWRHAFGMRCLKIPNTKHFHDITLMHDAIHRKCLSCCLS